MSTKESINRYNGNEILASLAEILSERLEQDGIESQKASNIVLSVLDILRFEFGGQYLYFPKGVTQNYDQKVWDIFNEFNNGKTVSELAYEYNYSVQNIYKLISKARAIRKKERDAQ